MMSDGSLWSWGQAEGGRLGRHISKKKQGDWQPGRVEIPVLENYKVINMASSHNTTIVAFRCESNFIVQGPIIQINYHPKSLNQKLHTHPHLTFIQLILAHMQITLNSWSLTILDHKNHHYWNTKASNDVYFQMRSLPDRCTKHLDQGISYRLVHFFCI